MASHGDSKHKSVGNRCDISTNWSPKSWSWRFGCPGSSRVKHCKHGFHAIEPSRTLNRICYVNWCSHAILNAPMTIWMSFEWRSRILDTISCTNWCPKCDFNRSEDDCDIFRVTKSWVRFVVPNGAPKTILRRLGNHCNSFRVTKLHCEHDLLGQRISTCDFERPEDDLNEP